MGTTLFKTFVIMSSSPLLLHVILSYVLQKMVMSVENQLNSQVDDIILLEFCILVWHDVIQLKVIDNVNISI